MAVRRIVVALCAAWVLIGAAAADASSGALSELPGTAACVSDDAYSPTPGLCRQGVGLDNPQSLAISPDGSSLYTAAVTSSAVDAFSRDQSTGLTTQVPTPAGGCISEAATTGCTIGAGLSGVDWVTVSPDGANVYAGAITSQAVDTFTRDPSTGGLTEAGCISSSATEPLCTMGRALQGSGVVAVSPDGKNAYVASFGNGGGTGSIAMFNRGSGGALAQPPDDTGCITNTSVSNCTLGANLSGAASVVVSPLGPGGQQFVYVAARLSQAVTVYSRDPTTGALTRLAGTAGCVGEATASTTCAQAPGMMGPNALSISGNYLFVSNFTNGQGSPNDSVVVFTRDPVSGALAEVGCINGGSVSVDGCTPLPVLGGNFAITASPDGSFIYVTDYQSDAVSVFTVGGPGGLTRLPGLNGCVSEDGSGGVCAQGVGLTLPHETIISPDGNFAYVVGRNSDTIDVFATVPGQPAPPSNGALPNITGTTNPGQTLTADNGSWTGTESGYSYQWESCDASGNACSAIAGARGYALNGQAFSASHVLASADAGHTLRIVVSAVNSAGTSSATSAATAVVTTPGPPPPPAPPANVTAPALTGTAKSGSTLTVSTGSWSGSPTGYRYQWARCNTAGAGCVGIAGAGASAYKLTAADVGHRVRGIVTATNAGGSTTAGSGATVVVTAGPAPANLTPPKISGAARVAGLLTAQPGTWSGSPSRYAYAWWGCTASGASCKPIAGATSATYKLTSSEFGRAVRVVVTATGSGGSTTVSSARSARIGEPVAILTCRTARTRHLRCTLALASGTVTRRRGNASASLSRRSVKYASGWSVALSAGRSKLYLTELRSLKRGSYVLSVRVRRGRGKYTQRLTLTLR